MDIPETKDLKSGWEESCSKGWFKVHDQKDTKDSERRPYSLRESKSYPYQKTKTICDLTNNPKSEALSHLMAHL